VRSPPTRGDAGVAAPAIAQPEVRPESNFDVESSRGEDPHPPATGDAVVAEATHLATVFPGGVILLAGVVPTPAGTVCACPACAGCGRAGKHPLGWWRGLTAGEVAGEVARIMEQTGVVPHVGIITGPKSGLCVIDVDMYGGDPLAELEAATGLRLESPVMTRTGRGGRHVWYRDDGWRSGTQVCSHVAGGPHVDVRAAGGLVVVPPSRGYAWIGAPPTAGLVAALPRVPEALHPYLRRADARAAGPVADARHTVSVDDAIARWPWLGEALHEVPVDGEDGTRPGRYQQTYHFAVRCDQAGIPAETIIRLIGHYAPAVDKEPAWVRSDAPRVTAKVVARRALDQHHRATTPAVADADLDRKLARLRTVACAYADARAPVLTALCQMAARAGTMQLTTSTRALASIAHVRARTVPAVLDKLVANGVVDSSAGPDGLAIGLRAAYAPPCVSGAVRACLLVSDPTHPVWHARAAGQDGRRVLETLAELGPLTCPKLSAALEWTCRRTLRKLCSLDLIAQLRPWGPWELAPGIDLADPSCLDAVFARVEARLAATGRLTISEASARAERRYDRDRARNAERRAAWLATRPAASDPGPDDAPLAEPDDGWLAEQAAMTPPRCQIGPAPDGPAIATLVDRPVPPSEVARGLPATLVRRYGVPVGTRTAATPIGVVSVPLYDRRRERVRFGVERAAELEPTPEATEAWRRWRSPLVVAAASTWWVSPDGERHETTTATVVIPRHRPVTIVTADLTVVRVRGRLDEAWGWL